MTAIRQKKLLQCMEAARDCAKMSFCALQHYQKNTKVVAEVSLTLPILKGLKDGYLSLLHPPYCHSGELDMMLGHCVFLKN